jgi:DNA-binding HxlR family transcriptional regulator
LKIFKIDSFSEIPPRVEYKLTDFGKDLAEKTVELNQWLLDKRVEEI